MRFRPFVLMFLATALPASLPASLAAGSPAVGAAAVLSLTDRVLAHVASTRYVLTGDQFDLAAGSYHLDCSGYTNNLLMRTAPTAYSEVEARSVQARPLARHYYELFSGFTGHTSGWERVQYARHLQPGDVLSWKYSPAYRDEHDVVSTGHVMIVLAAPDRQRDGTYIIKVSDSALHPHSDDTRRAGTSGVGAGSLRLWVDERDRPVAFAPTLAAEREDAVWIAAARPLK